MKRDQGVTLDAHTLIWYYHEESNIRLSQSMRNLPGLELHDRAIVATATITDSVLVSKDKDIKATGLNGSQPPLA